MVSILRTAHSLGDLDDATASLIVDLQLQDLEELSSLSKGKSREGEQTDTEVAMSVLKQELEISQSVIADRRMTRSVAQAISTDGSILTQVMHAEDTAARDRELAGQLSGNAPVPSGSLPPSLPAGEPLSDDIIAKLAGLYVSENIGQLLLKSSEESQEQEKDEASSSTYTGRSSQKRAMQERRFCEACRDIKLYFDLISVPCGHEYCRDCLHSLFRASMTDESLFPPRCCRQTVNLSAVGPFLTKELKEAFARRKVELSTPNRTYCSRTTCSAFIHPNQIEDDVGECFDCGTRTCVLCKGLPHDGDCPQDTALQQVLDAAEANGWQRCYQCRRLVELDIGCNHMTCPCGAQFCYLCGLQWKTCDCQQWTEDRLLARANQIVDRQPDPVPAPAARAERVQDAMQRLAQHHECDHDGRWRWIRGAHQCEECLHHLPQYIFECPDCMIRVCNRCRRNRL